MIIAISPVRRKRPELSSCFQLMGPLLKHVLVDRMGAILAFNDDLINVMLVCILVLSLPCIHKSLWDILWVSLEAIFRCVGFPLAIHVCIFRPQVSPRSSGKHALLSHSPQQLCELGKVVKQCD